MNLFDDFTNGSGVLEYSGGLQAKGSAEPLSFPLSVLPIVILSSEQDMYFFCIVRQ